MSEIERLTLHVEVLQMDRQMYADLLRKSVSEARAEGLAQGRHESACELQTAQKVEQSLSALCRKLAAAIGVEIDLPSVMQEARHAQPEVPR